MILLFLLLLLLLLSASLTIGNANEVVGEPFISCSADAIYGKWKTKNTFMGHVNVRYTPNRYCYQVLVTNNQIELLIPHQDCQLNRRRSLNPSGIIIETSVLISFHAQYVTKGDRIYQLQCIHSHFNSDGHSLMPGYVQQPSSSSSSTQSTFDDRLKVPKCEYKILNANDGTLIERARIGDSIRHQWSCKNTYNNNNNGRECLFISNCYLLTTDSKHRLIDERGCSLDTSIIPQLQYYDNMNVSQTMLVFGIEQKPYVRFQCQMSLTMPSSSPNDSCERPLCTNASNIRKRKSLRMINEDGSANNILDAISQQIEIVEFGQHFRGDNFQSNRCNSTTIVERMSSEEVICVSRLSFGIVAISTIMVAICTLLVVIISMVQRFHSNETRYG